MITCPRCGTPNPDQTVACLACSAALGGQRFAQGVDAAKPPPLPSAAEAGAPGRPAGEPPLKPTGTAAGQSEVQQFLEQSQRRSRRRRRTAAAISAGLLAALTVYVVHSAATERQRQAAALFLQAFGEVESGPLAGFWRCTVRAGQADVHRASDNLVVMEALTRAFNADPEHQPRDLEQKCLPLLATAETALAKLQAPETFVPAVATLRQQLLALRQVFASYIKRLAAVREQTAREQVLLSAARTFHGAGRSANDRAIAAGYVHALHCAIPALPRMAQQVRQAPDTQALVEHIYNSCKEDPRFASKLCDDCAAALADQRPERLTILVQRRMSGDDRDVSALEDCFRRAGRDAFGGALDAIGKTWVDYRNAVKGVFSRAAELGGKTSASQ
ncbi:MAG: hypothetical protein IPL40_11105 [Proteobacteria bacterium]|nr:hypothetical protein [Pseudomonadota bacterium]